MPNEYARGHVHAFGPYLYRSEFWATTPEQESERALQHLRRVVESEGPTGIAAILLETIPGTAGVLVPPPGYLAGVRRLCDQHGIVLILDEVMAGFGRTGEWFAFDGVDADLGVKPDLIAFAKGVNSGYVPVGGVVISDEIAADFDETVFPGGLTYSGHPLAAASIVAALDAMESEGIVANAKRDRRRRPRPGPARARREAPGRRRGPRHRRVLGDRAGLGRRGHATPVAPAVIGRAKKELLGPRPAALRRRQPHPRRTALRRHRRRGGRGAVHLRRSPDPARRGALTHDHP